MTRAWTNTYAMLMASVLAAAAIANGGRTPFEWNLCVGALGVLALVFGARAGLQARGGESQVPPLDRRLVVLAWLAPAYVAFQLLPLPLPVLRLLSSRRAEIAENLGKVVPVSWFAPISIEPASTVALLMTVIVCTLCFLIVRNLTWRALRSGSWVTILPVVALGVFEGGFAVWEAWTGDTVDGTYMNRNHLAGLLEMILPLSVAYAFATQRREKYGKHPGTTRGMIWAIVSGPALPMISVTIIFAGILASASKMGYVASLFGLLAMGLVAVLKRLSGVAKWASIGALPVLAVIGFVLLANQEVLARLATVLDSPDGLSGEGRIPIWADSLRLYAANPLFGSGFGTYATAFLGFQTSSVGFHWTHAHNDYVEMATDLGIIGLAIFGSLMLSVVARAIKLVRPARQSGSDLVALACVGSFAAIGIHSVVDFNLTVPANVLLLSWIAGIAAGIPLPRSIGGAEKELGGEFARRSRFRLRAQSIAAITLACVAIVMASTRLIAGAPTASPAPATLDQKSDDVRWSPASPYRWLDLAEAFSAQGQTAQAKASVLNALALAAHVPPVNLRAATLLDALGDRRAAVTLVMRLTRQTGGDDGQAFDWFTERRFQAKDVLSGISTDRRALQSYLRYLMLPGTCNEAQLAWRELVPRHHPDGRVASDYVNFLLNDCDRPGEGAQAWAAYVAATAPEYRVSNWVFNGDFERDPLPVPFDWRWSQRNAETEAAFDHSEKVSGARSLRMVFRGPKELYYEGAWQNIIVSPGLYRFSATVRTLELNDPEGVRLRISNAGEGPRLDIWTDQSTGTTAWHTVSSEVLIPDGITLLRVQVVRRPGNGAKNTGSVSGTAWVDAVTLTKVG